MTDAVISGSGSDQLTSGVRMVVLNLPEDSGEGLGFRLTRTQWDPYPWVREVSTGSRAQNAGLRMGDCLLQCDGVDLLGMPVSQIAGLIRGDGGGGAVTLIAWSCGVDPSDDPESLWSCGGTVSSVRPSRALGGVLRALACCVCGGTARDARACRRSHLYCDACWQRLDRCALCREPLPPKDSPYARNLVAEQVFEAIAAEYDLKPPAPRSPRSPRGPPPSAATSMPASPSRSPVAGRRAEYYVADVHRKKAVLFNDRLKQNYHSDPNIHRSSTNQKQVTKPTNLVENSKAGKWNNNQNGVANCSCSKIREIPKIVVDEYKNDGEEKSEAKLKSCSMVDLQRCALTNSLQNLNLKSCCDGPHSTSMDDLKSSLSSCCAPVVLLSPPIYLVANCQHKT